MTDRRILPIDPAQMPAGRVTKRKRQWPAYYRMALGVLPIFAGLFAAWAMWNLQNGTGFLNIFEAVLVGGVVAVVSYVVNRFAIDWGTDLAASGIHWAGAFSIISMLVVGSCLWAFTYAGITLPDARHLDLVDHGHALVTYIDAENAQATKSIRAVSVIRATNKDLSYHAQCEQENSCVSGRGNGGRGTIARALEEKAARADEIAAQVEAGAELHAATIADLNRLVGEYQTVLSDGEKYPSQRRSALIKIDAQIGQSIARLKEAVPVTLISAYAQELQAGVNIPARPLATQAVNALLGKHGQALASVLATVELREIERPVFPPEAGMASTFAHIGNFIAIAGVVFVAEGVFPLALWLYTFGYLYRLQNQATHGTSRPGNAIQIVRKPQGYSHTHLNGGDHVP